MGIANFVFRRGAIYTWRRRIPKRAESDAANLQVSLRTACPWTARRLAVIVTAESERVFDRMGMEGLTPQVAHEWLETVIREELERSARRDRAAFHLPQTGNPVESAHQDHLAGEALRLIARKGIELELDEDERRELTARGYSEADLDRINEYQVILGRDAATEPVENRIRRRVAGIAGKERISGHEFFDAKRIWLNGRAAALLSSKAGLDRGFDDAMAMAGRLRDGKPLPVAEDAAPPTPTSESAPAFDPALQAVADRLASRKEKRGRVTDKTAYQIRKTAELLHEATGIEDIRKLRQEHLMAFSNIMHALPPTYRKTPKERDMTLPQIIEAAETAGRKQGLSAATINRNLGFVGQLIKHARSEGLSLDPLLDTRDLRETDPEDDQDKVAPFSRDDLRRIFAGPVWQGCQSAGRRTRPGDLVIRDALYWLPLIAAYTGARREEIAGLAREDIVTEDGIAAFHFRPTEIRRLKNRPSQRKVPIHPHLLELGFLEHVAQAETGQVFPDLKRRKGRGTLSDAISFNWHKLLRSQLGEDAAKKNFHSFRHYVTDELRYRQDVPDLSRHHLLGHAISSEEDRRYGQRTPLPLLKPLIEALPRVF
ncbi:site-specific integrase [Paracoccus zeaxanthinifaciens]|uniref:site-specific integrase n=1 Tax=Paracoccus zeaxanthinifaciens TaxID=187400 RepID=UPI0003B67DC4|nr:site-specific integrase [Paracoccus zeaxanthinifaciens]